MTARTTTRRVFLGIAGAAVAGAGAFAGLSAGPDSAAVADRAKRRPPRTKAGVLTRADRSIGTRLRGSAWDAWFAGDLEQWGAAYVAWLLRGVGAPRTRSTARMYSWLLLRGRRIAKPRPGAVAITLRGRDTPIGLGMVVGVTAGIPQLVEGGQPSSVQPMEQFVRHLAAPRSTSVIYVMPRYHR